MKEKLDVIDLLFSASDEALISSECICSKKERFEDFFMKHRTDLSMLKKIFTKLILLWKKTQNTNVALLHESLSVNPETCHARMNIRLLRKYWSSMHI